LTKGTKLIVISVSTLTLGGILATMLGTEEGRAGIFRVIANLKTWGDPVKVLKRIKTYYGDIIKKYADKYNLPPALIASVIAYESNGVKQAYRKEKNGASYGLMQVMNFNYKGNPKDLFDPDTNIKVGTSILKNNYNELKDYTFAVAAYNAGIGQVKNIINKYNIIDWKEFIQKKDEIVKTNSSFVKWTIPYLERVFGEGGIYERAKEIFV